MRMLLTQIRPHKLTTLLTYSVWFGLCFILFVWLSLGHSSNEFLQVPGDMLRLKINNVILLFSFRFVIITCIQITTHQTHNILICLILLLIGYWFRCICVIDCRALIEWVIIGSRCRLTSRTDQDKVSLLFSFYFVLIICIQLYTHQTIIIYVLNVMVLILVSPRAPIAWVFTGSRFTP